MGVVFRARHRPTGQGVALKTLPPSFASNHDAVGRFRREVEAVSQVDHRNIVAVYDAGEDHGLQFLTMEYVRGHDLDRLVHDGGPMPVDLAMHCVIHAALGLAAAHTAGITHRDVKPANVMLDDAGSVRVLNLGLARVAETDAIPGQPGRPLDCTLTRTGAYLGTIDSMAPEQADDPRKADHRDDIDSLGCTLSFLLTGHPPFRGGPVWNRLLAPQKRPAPSLRAAGNREIRV